MQNQVSIAVISTQKKEEEEGSQQNSLKIKTLTNSIASSINNEDDSKSEDDYNQNDYN